MSEVRFAFSKAGGNLGTDGSVAYLFSKQGLITLAKTQETDALIECAIDAGAEDIASCGEDVEVTTAPEAMAAVREALETAGFSVSMAAVSEQASSEVELDLAGAEKLIRLIDLLEDCDDVQKVYSNGSISDEVLAKLG